MLNVLVNSGFADRDTALNTLESLGVDPGGGRDLKRRRICPDCQQIIVKGEGAVTFQPYPWPVKFEEVVDDIRGYIAEDTSFQYKLIVDRIPTLVREPAS